MQLYRVIGAMFLVAFAQDRLPAEFALPAGIGDVAVGLTAPLVAYGLVRRRRWSRRAALTWN
ncbi:MAG: MFS transporter, partial [Actinomycetota bacterium]|nr:MFS transporter [Actinomycetota bacterium]